MQPASRIDAAGAQHAQRATAERGYCSCSYLLFMLKGCDALAILLTSVLQSLYGMF